MSEFKTPEQLYKEAAALAEGLKGKDLTAKERRNIPQQEMPSQDPSVRRNNMERGRSGILGRTGHC